MFWHKIDKKYVSDIEKFMQAFDKKYPKSKSQQQEIAKYARIFRLRDQPEAVDGEETIWKDF